MVGAPLPALGLPRGLTQVGIFTPSAHAGWQTLVVRVDNELSSPAPKALPAGSRCILKRKECRSVGIAEKLLRDVRTLSHLEHPNVIKYFGVLLGSAATDVLLVCEFCTGGSLQDLIYHQRREKRSDSRDDGNLFAPELVLEFLLQLSSALTYLHDGVGLAHGNLTSTNAVLDGTGVIKITDVGLEDALDDPEYDPTRDVRDVAALRHERASIGFWAPERSLRNVSTGGFLPSGPSAPADCWALGCVATELSSGIFVHERLNACEGVSLALEHECLSAAIRHLDNVTSCGRCGQSGRDICAGCRVAWVAAALLARDPMRRPASSRAKSLLETCSWISGAEPAKVGSMLVPPLSIPPPSYCLSRDKSAHTTRGALAGRQCGSDTGNGPARHSGHDGMALVSALREALDGPDWRVFKDGKLLPSEWHHDKIIYSINGSAHGTNPAPDRGSQTDADLPHERGREISYQKMNGYADTGESEAAESPRWESLTERQKERRERAERRAASRGLADLYREAKHKQRPGGQVEEDVIPAPPNKAKHAGVGGVGGGVCATKDGADAASGVRVPKSSLKEGLGSSSGEQEQQAQPRAQGSGVKLGIGGVQGIEALLASVKAPAKQQVPRGSEVPLGSQGSDTVCSADKAAGRDLWDEWLSSLGGSPVAMHGDAAEDVEEDAASEASGGAELVGAEGADSLVGGDEDDGAGEMGPQDTVSADMQVAVGPLLLQHRGREQDVESGGGRADEASESGLEAGRRRDENVGVVGTDRGRPVSETRAEVEEGIEVLEASEHEARGRAREKEREEERDRQRRHQLSQHVLSVTNVAGNTVHVIGALSDDDTGEASVPSTPHEARSSSPTAPSQHPHPSPDDEERGPWEVREIARTGVWAHRGAAACFVEVELTDTRTVSGSGGVGGVREVYTVFMLNCKGSGVVWSVARRYSEFAELHQKMLSLLPSARGGASRARAALISKMPGKVYFGATSPDVVSNRQLLLSSYVLTLQRVLQQHRTTSTNRLAGTGAEPWVAQACDAWTHFVSTPETAFAAAALASAAYSSSASASASASASSYEPASAPTSGHGRSSSGLRSVLRRGPTSDKTVKKKVAVEDGRRQVVWGSDGVLQIDQRTFIAGSPERVPGPRVYKNGKPKLVDPAGPFARGWWEEQDKTVEDDGGESADGQAQAAGQEGEQVRGRVEEPAGTGTPTEDKDGDPKGSLGHGGVGERDDGHQLREVRVRVKRGGKAIDAMREEEEQKRELGTATTSREQASVNQQHRKGMTHPILLEETTLPLRTQRELQREREAARTSEEDGSRVMLTRDLDHVVLGRVPDSSGFRGTAPSLLPVNLSGAITLSTEAAAGDVASPAGDVAGGNRGNCGEGAGGGKGASLDESRWMTMSLGADAKQCARLRDTVLGVDWPGAGDCLLMEGKTAGVDAGVKHHGGPDVLDSKGSEAQRSTIPSLHDDDDLRQVEQALTKAQEAVSTLKHVDPTPSALLEREMELKKLVEQQELAEREETIGLSAADLHSLQGQGALSITPTPAPSHEDLAARLSLLRTELQQPTSPAGDQPNKSLLHSAARRHSNGAAAVSIGWKALPPLSPQSASDSSPSREAVSRALQANAVPRPPRERDAGAAAGSKGVGVPARWTANAKQSIDERKGSGQAKGDKDGGGGADGDGDSGGLDGLLRLPPMPAAQVLAAAAAAADEEECAGSEGSEDREAVQHVQARLDRRDLKREVTRTLDTLGKGEDANRLGDMDVVCDLEKLQRERDEATRQLRLWNEGVVDPADDLLAVPDIVGTGRAAARGDAAAGGKGAAGAHLVTLPNLALQDLEHVDIALSEDDEGTPGWGSEPLVEMLGAQV